jgi:hypothetical protein
MIGRWIQHRTGKFGNTLMDSRPRDAAASLAEQDTGGEASSLIPYEGIVSNKRMNFVFGWVHKLLNGTSQYEQAMKKSPSSDYRVYYGRTSQFSLGALTQFWRNYGYLYKDAPFADTYTVAFKQIPSKKEP